LVEKVGTYVTNTGLMATYGGQFTLTVYDTPVVIFSIWYIPRLPQSGSSQQQVGHQLTPTPPAHGYIIISPSG
ncbi:hypothetical protein, partial [Shigella boydii]|uniref:hypothetical protein n=1 Tax=Shigella boydii TaxID=621 RepID=UPI001C0A9242